MKKHYRHENDCLNCGTELNGKYCHQCGQENLQIKESFGHMITHAVGDYFHFDHQFFHTLKPLFFSPGKLTNEYMAGRRVQYLHPVKMYIFISLVYFVLLFSRSESEATKLMNDKKNAKTELGNEANAYRDTGALTPEQKREILLKLHQFAGAQDGKIDTATFKSIKTDTLKNGKKDTTYVFDDFTVRKKKNGNLDTTYNFDGLSDFVITATDYATYQEYLNNQQKLPESERDNFLERYINKKMYAGKEKGADDSEKMIVEAVKHNAPKMMFLLLPLFALMLKIAFYKNKKFYVEHLIFSFHLHCFLFLFLTIIMLIKIPMPDSWKSVDKALNIASLFIITYYVYKALKVVYNRSRIRTITKMMGLAFSYFMAFAITLGILFIVSAIFAF